jgi:hypothetical protein
VLMWRTLTKSTDPRFMVSGTELSVALFGPSSRFAVYEIRTRGGTRRYVIRDAERVSDADRRAGKRPPIVGQTDDYDALMLLVEAEEKR